MAGVTDRFYASHAELFEDVLAILRALIGDAIAAGARYIQLDFPRYVHLIDEAPATGASRAGRGSRTSSSSAHSTRTAA